MTFRVGLSRLLLDTIKEGFVPILVWISQKKKYFIFYLHQIVKFIYNMSQKSLHVMSITNSSNIALSNCVIVMNKIITLFWDFLYPTGFLIGGSLSPTKEGNSNSF